ncbi:MAG: aspartyl protease family protein [Armatimonadetes bacterium]|nr:aspartyl protease family protein [Armatimonadota bacterium]
MSQRSEKVVVDRATCIGKVIAPILPGRRKAPLIAVKIGGKPYRMLLDTGGQGGRISEDVAKALGLQPIGEVRAGDPSGKNSQRLFLYKIPEIVIGNAHLYGVRMIGSKGRDHGVDSDGVLGTNAFGDLLVTLDFPRKQIEIENGSLPSDSMPYRVLNGVPALTVEVGKVKIDAHVDSGSDGGLMIPLSYQDQLPLAEKPHVVGHARSLFNDFDIYAAKLNGKVKIGGVPFDITTVEMHNAFPMGNIGGRVLQNYAVTIDRKNKRIRFKKG